MWDEDEHGNWHLTASWKAHSGSVWKVTWAHPEFGQVLATCSFDRTAAVWEEIGMYALLVTSYSIMYYILSSYLMQLKDQDLESVVCAIGLEEQI